MAAAKAILRELYFRSIDPLKYVLSHRYGWRFCSSVSSNGNQLQGGTRQEKEEESPAGKMLDLVVSSLRVDRVLSSGLGMGRRFVFFFFEPPIQGTLQLPCTDLNFGASLLAFFFFNFSSLCHFFSKFLSHICIRCVFVVSSQLKRRKTICAGRTLWLFNGIGTPLEKEPQSKVLTRTSRQGLIHMSRRMLCNAYFKKVH